MVNANMFDLTAPRTNEIRIMCQSVWRCVYRNTGKARITFELMGHLFHRQVPNEETPILMIRLHRSGEEMTMQAFRKYKRDRWPESHEVGRNPDNVTLGVQSAVASPVSAFRKPEGR